jgi:hypothetical protein
MHVGSTRLGAVSRLGEIDKDIVRRHMPPVTESPKPEPRLTPAAMKLRAEREARQAAALRANLRRRKAQERGRDARETPGADIAEPGSAHSLYPDISD